MMARGAADSNGHTMVITRCGRLVGWAGPNDLYYKLGHQAARVNRMLQGVGAGRGLAAAGGLQVKEE